MTHPLTPREKVVFKQPCENCQRMTTVDLNAVASGSGDHTELAACPFCGGPAKSETLGHGKFARTGVKCADADCPGSMRLVSHDEDGVAFWNRRPREAALLAENAALRESEKSALKECGEWARKAGEAIGKLEMSEAAGIVEGWQERATEAERKLAEAVGLLREWMGTWFVDADSRGESAIADDTRKFLSKEAERG